MDRWPHRDLRFALLLLRSRQLHAPAGRPLRLRLGRHRAGTNKRGFARGMGFQAQRSRLIAQGLAVRVFGLERQRGAILHDIGKVTLHPRPGRLRLGLRPLSQSLRLSLRISLRAKLALDPLKSAGLHRLLRAEDLDFRSGHPGWIARVPALGGA